MKQIIKLSVTLAAYTVVACIALAAVYSFTAPQIAAVKAEKTNAALRAVFPEADNFKEVTAEFPAGIEKTKFLNAYIAEKDGKPIGLTLTANGPTYSKATILIAIGLDKTIKKISFLELTDTPGLGSKATEEPFIGQFNGKALNSAFTVNNDIDGISGATITSRGVAAILKAGAEAAASFIGTNNLSQSKEEK